MQTEILFGPPGTGKTTSLLDIMEKEMAAGVSPNKIAFVSFTRKAANEAAERAMEKFDFTRTALPYFRTLHSLAYRMLELRDGDTMGREQYRELAKSLGMNYQGTVMEDELSQNTGEMDQYVFVDNLARSTEQNLYKIWHDYYPDLSWRELELFSGAHQAYKESKVMLDFTDYLQLFIDNKETVDIEVAIIDEAQDLSSLQWRMVLQAITHASRVYIAGDDDQAIYEWSGADVQRFINFKGTRTVLKKSYRLPPAIWQFGNRIAAHIKHRVPKEWAPADKPGSIETYSSLQYLNINLDESWLLLCRNRFQFTDIEAHVRDMGITYTLGKRTSVSANHLHAIQTWEAVRRGERKSKSALKVVRDMMRPKPELPFGEEEEMFNLVDLKRINWPVDEIWHRALKRIPVPQRQYYIECLRNGTRLQDTPQVHISTIHGVKGGEADNVVLLSDMSWRTWNGMQHNPDAEHRVFYVGATRARRMLHVIEPQSMRFYPLANFL